MSVTISEKIESRSLGFNGSTLQGFRWFQADAPPDVVVFGPPGDLPIPQQSRWPNGTEAGTERLLCDRLDVDYQPNSLNRSIIKASYSSDGSLRGARLNPLQPGFASWTISYRRVEQQLPYWILNPFQYHYTDINGETQFIQAYDVKAETHLETRKILSRRVTLKGLGFDYIEAIGSQTGRLHKINNLWYSFTVGDIIQQDPTTWATTYTWEYDPGTPNFFQVGQNQQFGFPRGSFCQPPGMYPQVAFCRPPFHIFAVLPGQFDQGPPPRFGVPNIENFIVPFDFLHPDSWHTLPGMIA